MEDEIKQLVEATIHRDTNRGYRAGELYKELSDAARDQLGKVTGLCRVLERNQDVWDLDTIRVRLPAPRPPVNGGPYPPRSSQFSDMVSVYFSIREGPPEGKALTC